jgi:excinuclease ABC subunit A
LSLAGGAVRGWDRRNAYYFQLIQSLARHTKFDIEAPFESLPQKIKDLVLFGSGEEQIEFKYLDGKGGTVKRRHTFEGIVNNLERRYKETESATVREELAKYRSSRPCPECHGTRLNRAARNVFVDGKSVPEVSSLSVERAIEFFAKLKLPGWRGEIAVKIVKEIGDRLGFLGNVGLGYLTLESQRRHLVGRRGAAHPPREPDRLRAGRRHVHPR